MSGTPPSVRAHAPHTRPNSPEWFPWPDPGAWVQPGLVYIRAEKRVSGMGGVWLPFRMGWAGSKTAGHSANGCLGVDVSIPYCERVPHSKLGRTSPHPTGTERRTQAGMLRPNLCPFPEADAVQTGDSRPLCLPPTGAEGHADGQGSVLLVFPPTCAAGALPSCSGPCVPPGDIRSSSVSAAQ